MKAIFRFLDLRKVYCNQLLGLQCAYIANQVAQIFHFFLRAGCNLVCKQANDYWFTSSCWGITTRVVIGDFQKLATGGRYDR